MPLPEPEEGEDEQEFVSRCVSELSDEGEFDSQDQRIAVCYKQWEKANEAITKQEVQDYLKGDVNDGRQE